MINDEKNVSMVSPPEEEVSRDCTTSNTSPSKTKYMFRGEPTAYSTILWGYVFYILTLIFGLAMPHALDLDISLVYQSHYLAAFLGFIGLVILGAQMQFFRAIAAVRKFEPPYLQVVYQAALIGGVILSIAGSIAQIDDVVLVGIIMFFAGAIIHSYWIWNASQSDLFKFPLNYLRGAHIFLLAGLIILIQVGLDNPLNLASDNFIIIHILGTGWISLSLQGAIIRIVPMFGGQVINRSFRPYIDTHFYFSFFSSIVASTGFYLENNSILAIGTILWVASWIWVFALVIRSNLMSRKQLDYPFTFVMFVSGLVSMAIGSFVGIDHQLLNSSLDLARGVHIHTMLLSGLSLIMVGAIHRINAFQTFTILYTGRRDEGYRLDDFLNMDRIKYIFVGMILATVFVVLGFSSDTTGLIVTGAGTQVLLAIIFGLHLMNNYLHYRREIKNAIPYWLKPSEYKE